MTVASANPAGRVLDVILGTVGSHLPFSSEPCHPSRSALRAFHTVAWPSSLEGDVRKWWVCAQQESNCLCKAPSGLRIRASAPTSAPQKVSSLPSVFPNRDRPSQS
jgi:hypothetical protein